jgi:hypothetical protein
MEDLNSASKCSELVWSVSAKESTALITTMPSTPEISASLMTKLHILNTNMEGDRLREAIRPKPKPTPRLEHKLVLKLELKPEHKLALLRLALFPTLILLEHLKEEQLKEAEFQQLVLPVPFLPLEIMVLVQSILLNSTIIVPAIHPMLATAVVTAHVLETSHHPLIPITTELQMSAV